MLKKIDSDSQFSTFLRSIESTLMLLKIAKRIAEEYPWLPIFSIHDCLATIWGCEELVKEVMVDEFTKCIGIPPHIKVEKWY